MNTVEEFAAAVANKVSPQPQADAGISPAMVEMIMQIIMSLVQNCPKNNAAIASIIKKPNIRQRANFRSQVMNSCECCFRAQFRRQSGAIADECLTAASALTDGEIASIIFDASNPDFIVI